MMPISVRLPRLTLAMPRPGLESEPGEWQLVREARAGSRAAFGELYTRFARMVHGILLARVPYSDAEDLAQDVFLSAFGKLSTLREPGAFPGWLASMARNRATEFHRAARYREQAHARAEHPDRSGPDATAIHILEVIQSLPEAYRETLVLRLVEGMTGPEIAERTGLTPDSVRVNLFRGMKLLRERLGRGGAE